MRTTNYCTGHMHSGLTSALIKKGLTSALDHHGTTSLLTSTQVGFEFGGSMFVVFYWKCKNTRRICTLLVTLLWKSNIRLKAALVSVQIPYGGGPLSLTVIVPSSSQCGNAYRSTWRVEGPHLSAAALFWVYRHFVQYCFCSRWHGHGPHLLCVCVCVCFLNHPHLLCL